MKKNFLLSCGLPIFLSIFVSIFSIPFYSLNSENVIFSASSITSNFFWPTRGYTKITSKFGYRNAPTKGAGTYHGGIDIAAPEGSNICSIEDGIVKYIGWNGATRLYRYDFARKWCYKHLWTCIQ